MTENSVSRLNTGFIPNATNTERQVGEGRDIFDSLLESAIHVVGTTNQNLIRSDTAQVNFATGQETNMLTVILAQERANSSLSFTTQITNRIIESYREIMRMQV